MKASKNIVRKLGTLALLLPLTGCAIFVPATAAVTSTFEAVFWSTPGSEANDSFESWQDDWSRNFHGQWRAMGRDVKQAQNSFNRVFLNYNPDMDPYL